MTPSSWPRCRATDSTPSPAWTPISTACRGSRATPRRELPAKSGRHQRRPLRFPCPKCVGRRTQIDKTPKMVEKACYLRVRQAALFAVTREKAKGDGKSRTQRQGLDVGDDTTSARS